jgi:hypothetical protein
VTDNSEHHYNNGNLEKEARLFARYLIDCEPPPEMIVRYINANRKLCADAAIGIDVKMMKYAVTHPWSVPFLDAAAGFLRPDSLLRKRIYIMAAVLEASTMYSHRFLPQALSPIRLFVHLVVNGVAVGIKVIIGIPIFCFLRK